MRASKHARGKNERAFMRVSSFVTLLRIGCGFRAAQMFLNSTPTPATDTKEHDKRV
jgi:hypothetical protein